MPSQKRWACSGLQLWILAPYNAVIHLAWIRRIGRLFAFSEDSLEVGHVDLAVSLPTLQRTHTSKEQFIQQAHYCIMLISGERKSCALITCRRYIACSRSNFALLHALHYIACAWTHISRLYVDVRWPTWPGYVGEVAVFRRRGASWRSSYTVERKGL